MLHKFVLGIAAVLAAASVNVCAAQPYQSAITSAHWKDYKSYYPTSHLCKANEITLWTCHGKTKVYSLCSSRDITKTSGYIQYRAGNGHNITFRFPAHKRPPLGAFTYITYGNGDAEILFRNGAYEYSLFDSLRGPSSIEVVRKPGNKVAADISCSNGNQSLQLNYTIKLMESAGISP